jgi:hypothetical protein
MLINFGAIAWNGNDCLIKSIKFFKLNQVNK